MKITTVISAMQQMLTKPEKLVLKYTMYHSKCNRLYQKVKLSSFESGKNVTEKGDRSYRGLGYSSLVSDPLG